ncbi:MAG TPA: sulfite exporter TauE/SafE family protein, partial [Agriterribacter sp.]|nr:sulfite exporter TauE/SafE family protein [Agriterribacter sp.]
SSLHCVGMCGPLALMLPVHHLTNVKRFTALLLYQLGRIVTYSLLGLVFGLAGRRIYIAGFQQWFSIGMGILIVVILIAYYGYHKNIQPPFVSKLNTRVQKFIIVILQSRKTTFSFLLLGMANGLLPCGMVYVAIAGALTTSAITNGVLLMAMFGAGTAPAMMMVSYLGTSPGTQLRHAFRKIIPIGVAVMAVFLILRGMNLGIPFVSPVLQSKPGTPVECTEAVIAKQAK